jgi:hypothetical protein
MYNIDLLIYEWHCIHMFDISFYMQEESTIFGLNLYHLNNLTAWANLFGLMYKIQCQPSVVLHLSKKKVLCCIFVY